jgi:NAD-dependent DNA ligase
MDVDKLSAGEIVDLLERASDTYYNTSGTLISDDLFDLLKARLRKLAPKHPFLKQVGAPVVAGAKVPLPFWMGSLDKIRDDEKALQKWKAKYVGEYIVSDKLDGNSALLVYDKQGKMRLFSRGDGVHGQDITHLIPHLTLPRLGAPLAIRGELIISKENWATISDVGANARNVVAGVMHSKVPEPSVAQLIDFVAYDVLSPQMKLSDAFDYLTSKGFLVPFHKRFNDITLTTDELSSLLVRRRHESVYDIDGIVCVHDGVHKSITGKNPAFGFAFKSILTHEEAEVVVTKVEWNASKDGYLKPLVHFNTVVIAGVKISKATGFNAQFIEKHIIGTGSRIVIIRSGDVIPHILKVITPAATGIPSFPTDLEYKWNDTHVDIMVKGESSQVALRQMEHFCASLDIKHVAAGTLSKLYNNGYDTIPKLLRISEADLLKIDGFKETSAKKIVNALQQAKEAPCEDLMVASNLFGRGLGKKKIALITSTFPQIRERQSVTVDDLQKVDGIGAVTAQAFVKQLPSFFTFMDEIGVSCHHAINTERAECASERDFRGQTIVFTGFRNKEWEAIVEKHGGKISGSVSKKTSLLVAADPTEESSKVQKARELQILIMSKAEFEKQLRC